LDEAVGSGFGMWLGLTCNSDGNCTWVDGTPFDYNAWATGNPIPFNGLCGQMTLSVAQRGKWVSADCNRASLTFLCKANTPTAGAANRVCSPGYFALTQDWCYTYYDELTDVGVSEVTCQRDGAQSVSIHSEAENDAVFEFTLDYINSTDLIWLGMRRNNATGEYSWIDGSPLDYTKWDDNEPDPDVGSCVSMTLGAFGAFKVWGAVPCTGLPQPFICKKPALNPTINPNVCADQNNFTGSGVLSSPGYPQNYGNNLLCFYYLTAAPGYSRVGIAFDDFNTEACCDSVFVFDGPTNFSPLIVKIAGCPSSIGQYYFSTQPQMAMVFQSDSSIVFTGWTARFQSYNATIV